MEAQKIVPGGGLAEDHPEQLRKAERPGQPGVSEPGQQRFGGARPGNDRVHQPDGADQYQRQQAVGVHQRKRTGQQRQRGPKAMLPLKGEAIQQVQAGEQRGPAEQGGPLGNQQVSNGVDPANVFFHIIGGRFVKCGENAGEVARLTAEKIDKA